MLDTILFSLILFALGIVVAASFWFLSYHASRKATSDELDERGMIGRKRR